MIKGDKMKTLLIVLAVFVNVVCSGQDRKVEIEPMQILNKTAVYVEFDNVINYIDADSTIGFGVKFLDANNNLIYQYGNTYKFNVNSKANLEDMKAIIKNEFGVEYIEQ